MAPLRETLKRRPQDLHPRLSEETDSKKAVTINNERPEAVYRFFRDFTNLPLFMKDLSNVEIESSKASRWTVRLDSGLEATWDAEITRDIPNELISWKSKKGSDVDTEGTITFRKASGGSGTVVTLKMSYELPTGELGELVTKLMGEDPDTLAHINLRRMKSLLETGEVPTTQGQPSGRSAEAEIILKH